MQPGAGGQKAAGAFYMGDFSHWDTRIAGPAILGDQEGEKRFPDGS
jgi:hypothetical protein